MHVRAAQVERVDKKKQLQSFQNISVINTEL